VGASIRLLLLVHETPPLYYTGGIIQFPHTSGMDYEPVEPHAGGSKGLARLAIDVTPLKHSRDFRLLWFGNAVSFLGTQITFVAIPFQVYELTESTLAVGLIGLVELIPLVTLSLLGGAVADRMDRRTLLIRTDTALAATSGLLAINATIGKPQLWAIYALAAVSAALFAFGLPALRSTAPLLLPTRLLPAAAALSSIQGSLGFIVGPLLGGVLIEAVSLPWTYLLDAATYVFSLLLVIAVAPIPPVNSGSAAKPSVLDGFRFLHGRPVLQGSFYVDLMAMVFGMPKALFPAIAVVRFGGGPSVLGLLYAAPAVGSFLAAATSGWAGGVRRQGLAVYAAVIGWGAALVVFGVAHSLWLALGALAAAGAADTISGVFRTAILQASAPAHMQGRLSGVELMVVASGPALGDLEAGALAAVTSVRFSVISGGLGCIVGVGVMAMLLPEFARYEARSQDAVN
jgi:MFS family permease